MNFPGLDKLLPERPSDQESDRGRRKSVGNPEADGKGKKEDQRDGKE